jgi:DNA-binding NarL/FixJ family response regulator
MTGEDVRVKAGVASGTGSVGKAEAWRSEPASRPEASVGKATAKRSAKRAARAARARALLAAGRSVGYVARDMKLSEKTIRRYRDGVGSGTDRETPG